MKVLPYGRSRRLGQIAAVILVALTVFLFFAAVGVHYAQKQIIKTKARIAADAGALYLGSIIGSYAHYLSKMAVKGQCRKKKRRWGILAWAVAIVVAVVTYGAGAHISAAIIAAASTGSFALNEAQVSKAVSQLNKQFKKLSSLDVKRSLKWQTISYVLPMVVEDPGAMEKLNENIERIVNEAENGSGSSSSSKGYLAEKQAVEKDLQEFWRNEINPSLRPLRNRMPLFDSIRKLDGNVPTPFITNNWPIIDECSVVDSDGFCVDTNPVFYSDLDYVNQVLEGTITGGEGLIDIVNKGMSGGEDAISAWDLVYNEECRKEGVDCDDLYDIPKQLEDVKEALGNLQRQIGRISEINGLAICDTGCTGIEIPYTGNPIRTMDEILGHIKAGDDIYMTESDFNDFKQGYIDALGELIKSADEIKHKILNNSDFADRIEALYEEPDEDFFSYAWEDKLGRHHSVEIHVSFKMPKIKVKKRLTSVTIKVKRCSQDVKVTVVRNGYRFTSKMHYRATRPVDDKNYWYLH